MKKNVLYLHCHDAGRWLQPYSPGFPTPNLNRLAEQSTLFRNAHCANPTCSPSRASLLTGQWPHQQMFGLAHRGFSLLEPKHHLGNFLKSHGYHTALCGVQHEFGAPSDDWPYEEQHQPTNSRAHEFPYDGDIADLAVEFLGSAQAKEPFFFSCGFFYPHREFPKQHDFNPDYLSPPSILPDTADIRKDLSEYYAAVEEMDRSAGKVLDALEANGLADNTIVIFTTDHGPAFPFMKCTLKDAGTGVALMLRNPEKAEASVNDALISHVDVFPTLCDMLELPHPDWLEGTSFVPILEGRKKQIRDELFSQVNVHASYEPKRAVRTHTHKLIVNYECHGNGYPLSNIDHGYSKSVLLKHSLAERERPEVELYDLMLDPAERNNLAADEKHRALLDELKDRLKRWQIATDDPILRGPIKIPEDALVTPHEQENY